MKNILVLGGTGAMGRYVVPELLKLGYKVDVVSLDDIKSDNPNLSYVKENAMDDEFIGKLIEKHYDCVIDFMRYYMPQLKKRLQMFCENCGQYIFTSTCRVFADSKVIYEDSPRLLDVSTDKEYLARKDTEYSLYKALEENLIKESPYKNWTIVRPATTYSTARLQLVTLEANSFLWRALNNKAIVLPKEAMDKQATMTWGGDVGKMIALLAANEKALGETFEVATSEHHSWQEIIEYYQENVKFEYALVDNETYLNCISDADWYPHAKYQLIYARLFNRVTDNQKILKATGMKQEDLMPLRDGLKREIAATTLDMLPPSEYVNEQMDKFFQK